MKQYAKIGDVVTAFGRWNACYTRPAWEAKIRLTHVELRSDAHPSVPGWPTYLRGEVVSSVAQPSPGQVAQGDATGRAPAVGAQMEWIESCSPRVGEGRWRMKR